MLGCEAVRQVEDAAPCGLRQPRGRRTVRDTGTAGVGAAVQIQHHALALLQSGPQPFAAQGAELRHLDLHAERHPEHALRCRFTRQPVFRQRQFAPTELGQLVLDDVVEQTRAQ